MKSLEVQIFQNRLVEWYQQNKRDLPWRATKDPYFIWLSEIILQQTRVDQGIRYYYRFIENYPTVESLAESSEEEVLKLWQGLGYYTRARNLYKTACIIHKHYNNRFPESYTELLKLPGIGTYTAAAISGFAFNLPHATVDGNVYRVLARICGNSTPIDTGQGRKSFQLLAEQFLDRKDPGTYNQAIMEFGALQCTPVSPKCEICPLIDFCKAYRNNTIDLLPVKQGKVKQRTRYFNYFYVTNNNNTYLRKRTGNDIWHNLYEFPLIETTIKQEIDNLIKSEEFVKLFGKIKIKIAPNAVFRKHILSHQIIYASLYCIQIKEPTFNIKGYTKLSINQFDNYPVSRLTEVLYEELLAQKQTTTITL